MFGREVIHAHPHVWLLNVSLVVTSLVILHFLFTYIYIYMYTYILSSRFFVAQFGLYQTWVNLGVPFRTALVKCRQQKQLHRFKPGPSSQWKTATFGMTMMSTFRHSDPRQMGFL